VPKIYPFLWFDPSRRSRVPRPAVFRVRFLTLTSAFPLVLRRYNTDKISIDIVNYF